MVKQLFNRFKNLFKKEESVFDHCDNCQRQLHILKTTPVDQRPYYVDCIGQMCKECYDFLYMNRPEYPVFGYE